MATAPASGTRRRIRGWPCLPLAIALGVLSSTTTSRAGAATVMVVVNRNGPLTTASNGQLRDVFLGRVRFVQNTRVYLVQLQGPPRQIVLRALVDMSESEFQLHWMRKAYEDGISPPALRSTPEDVLERVRQEKGAVGFVDRTSFRASDDLSVVYEAEGR